MKAFAERTFELDRNEEGRTRRDRLESRLERAIRKGRQDVVEELEAELWVPPFPKAAGHVWEAWQRIRRRKGIGPHGLAPLEWPDIDAFIRLTRTPLDSLDVYYLEMLDDAFILKSSETATQSDKNQALKDGLRAAGRRKH